jgi:hypothetical protein
MDCLQLPTCAAWICQVVRLQLSTEGGIPVVAEQSHLHAHLSSQAIDGIITSALNLPFQHCEGVMHKAAEMLTVISARCMACHVIEQV